jgi:hypothetical protein
MATTVFPSTIGGCLAALAKILKDKEKIEVKLQPLAEQEKALREHLINTFKKDELNGSRGSGLVASIVTTRSPKIGDWEKFWAFAKKKGNDDLLPRSISSAAWRARVEEGRTVPGVEIFTNTGLRIGVDKKKDE